MTSGKGRGGPVGRVDSEMQGKDKEVLVAPEGALELSHTSVGEARVPSHGTVMDHSSPGKACDQEQGRPVHQGNSKSTPASCTPSSWEELAISPEPSPVLTRATAGSPEPHREAVLAGIKTQC